MALALQQTAQPPRATSCRHAAAPLPCGSPARLLGGWRRQRRRQQRGDALVLATKPDVGYKSEAEETTEKWGLEAGLLKVATDKSNDGRSKAQQAKDLLARYGSAYLITSISFAIVSFAACYAAVDAGLDVAALLQRFGLQVNNTNETVGTFAIAYAAHKALSPVRFPPTVALTPLVAKWLGKEPAPAAGGSE